MATLYELTTEYMGLLNMAEEEEVDPQVLADTLEGMDGELEQKAENYAIMINTLNGQADLLNAEIKRLTDRKKTLENNANRMKEALENIMNVTGKRKFKTLLFSFNIQKNPPVLVVDDESKVPEEFVKFKKEFDKTALKKFVKENENSLDFAHLEQKESLRIR